MAYNELTTSLYSKRGDIDGIDPHKNRGSIYGVKQRERSNRISDNWFIYQQDEITIALKTASQMYVPWAGESIDTWEKVEAQSKKELSAKLGFVSVDQIHKSFAYKRISERYFFYPVGKRPSEDAIDKMLDKYDRRHNKKPAV